MYLTDEQVRERLHEVLQRLIRDRTGLSNEKFSREVNMSGQAIGDVCNGKHIPRADRLFNIAERLGVSIYYLISDDSAAPKVSAVKKKPANRRKRKTRSKVSTK